MPETQWFYVTEGQQAGPMDPSALAALARNGTLKPTDRVWREGLPDWVEAQTVFETIEPAPPVVAPPHAIPVATLAYDSGSGPVSFAAAQALRQTRPWVFLLATLGFCLSGLIAFVLVALGITAVRYSPGMSESMMIFLMYAIMGAISVTLSILLTRYGRRIGKVVASRQTHDLETALEAQKSFWRMTGVLAILGIVAIGGLVAFAVYNEL